MMMIKKGCRKLASQFLPGWVQWAEEYTGLKAGRVRIGDQATRWGSCSASGHRFIELENHLIAQRLGELCDFS